MTTIVPPAAIQAIAEGEPPQKDAVFGWQAGGEITALLIAYANPGSEAPDLSFLPRADVPSDRWPPLDGPSLTCRIGDYYREGRLLDLTGFIDDSQNLIFWVPTPDAIGSGCVAVEIDIPGFECGDWTLRRGSYVFYRDLCNGTTRPMDALLADTGRLDLGRRFSANSPEPHGGQS